MEALNDMVQTGKVRVLGASAMYAIQFQDMQKFAQNNDWTPFSARRSITTCTTGRTRRT